MYSITADIDRNVLHLRIRPPLSVEEQEHGVRDFYRHLSEDIRPGAILVSDIIREAGTGVSVHDEVSARMCAEKIELGIRILHDPDRDPVESPAPPTPYPVIFARDEAAAEKLIAAYRREHPAG